MMTVTIAPELEGKVKQQALREGLSVELWLNHVVQLQLEQGAQGSPDEPEPGSVVGRMRALRAGVKPDPDGWTTRDYVEHGRR